jgi:hypothetical protein
VIFFFSSLDSKNKTMSKKPQSKPMPAYKELDHSGRRLVNKLIVSLHDKQLPEATRMDINRSINRSRRGPKDTGKKYTNGYLMFYKEKFAPLKMTEADTPVTEIAKQLGAEWKLLTEEEKAIYKLMAAEQR